MPYAYRKIRNQNAYRVFNKITGVIHSNHTTLDNAKKQIRLLNAIENNPDFKPKKVGRGGSEYGTDDELVAIDEDRKRRQERQRTTDRKTQLQIDRLNALKLIPNPTERDKISISFLEKQIRKALMERGEEGYAISPEPIIEPSQPSKKPRSGSGMKKVGTGDRTPPQTQPNLRTPTRRRNRRGGVPVIPNIIPPLPATPEQQFIIQQPIQTQPQPARGVNLFGNPPAIPPNQIGSSSSSASSTPRQDDKRRRTGRGTAGSKEVASITEDARKRGEELKKRIAEIEKSNVKKADTLKKAELKRIKAELKKIEEEDPDYVAVDIPEINTGKGLPAGDIQKLLKNSYQIPPAETVGDFVLDKSLSGRRVQVYKNRNTPQAVVVHRGTQGAKDWATDLFYATGGDTTKTNRFKHAADIQKKAESKYGAKNITTLGHSLGAKISSTVGQNSKEIINLNKAVSPLDAVQKTSDKEINIRTSGDPVSALLPIKNNQRTITIPSKTYNPLTEHSTDTLNRLPENQIIGSGAAISAIRQAFRGKPYVIEGLERIEKADMKDTIFLAVFRMMRRYSDEEETITLPTPFDILFDFLKENYETEYQGGFYQEIAAEIIDNRDIPAQDLKEVVIDWIYSIPEFQAPLLDTSAPTEAEVVGEPPIAEATIQGEGLKGRYKNRKSIVPFENRMFNRGVEIMPSIGEAEDTFKYKDLSIGEISSLIQVQHDKGDYDNMKEPLKSLVYALDVKTKRGYGIDDVVNFNEELRRRCLYALESIAEEPQYREIMNNGGNNMNANRLYYILQKFYSVVGGGRNKRYIKDLFRAAIYYFTFLLDSRNNTPENIDIINRIGNDSRLSDADNDIQLVSQLMLLERGGDNDRWRQADYDRILQVIVDILNKPSNFTIPIPTTVSKTPSSQSHTTATPTTAEPITEAIEQRTLPTTSVYPIETDTVERYDDAGNLIGYSEVLPEEYAGDPRIRYKPPGFINLKSGEGLAKKISPSNKKMVGKTNPWVEYVKSFAKGKGINYASAMKHPDLKKGYKKGGMVEEDAEFKKIIKEEIKSPFMTAKEQDKISCPYCDKELKYKGLSRHIASVHKGLPYEYQRDKITPSNRGLPIKKGKGMSIINKPVAIRGKGMPTSKEAVIAEAYDARELGANGGKRYVSL